MIDPGNATPGLAPIIVSQYLAALEMLKAAIDRCPDDLWNDPRDKTPVWHAAYHVLFYTHFYLQDSEDSFVPWVKHRQEYQFIGPLPWPPHRAPEIGEPFDRATVLEYLAFCQAEARRRVPALDLDAASGFDWLPFGKLELQLYSIRHIQQHTGELMERLGARAGLDDLPWVGMGAA